MVKTEIETQFGMNGERITVIPNGFDAPERMADERAVMRQEMRDSWAVGPDKKAILFVGSGWGAERASVCD